MSRKKSHWNNRVAQAQKELSGQHFHYKDKPVNGSPTDRQIYAIRAICKTKNLESSIIGMNRKEASDIIAYFKKPEENPKPRCFKKYIKPLAEKTEEEMKTGVNTNTIIDPMKERQRNGIKAVKSNCSSCIYYNKKKCKFNKDTSGRTKCIKFTTQGAYNAGEKPKARVIQKSSFKKLSEFFETTITQETVTAQNRVIGKGYTIKRYKSNPFTIVLRHRKSKKEQYFEIIDAVNIER